MKKLRAHVSERYAGAAGAKLQKRYRVRTRWVRAKMKKKKT